MVAMAIHFVLILKNIFQKVKYTQNNNNIVSRQNDIKNINIVIGE